MKKLIFLFVSLLCSYTMANAQSQYNGPITLSSGGSITKTVTFTYTNGDSFNCTFYLEDGYLAVDLESTGNTDHLYAAKFTFYSDTYPNGYAPSQIFVNGSEIPDQGGFPDYWIGWSMFTDDTGYNGGGSDLTANVEMYYISSNPICNFNLELSGNSVWWGVDDYTN